MAFIYSITNLKRYRIYIGHTALKYLSTRFNNHQCELRNQKHHNKKLQKDWIRYGEENFLFTLIEECSDENKLKREQFWIDYYEPYYNACRVAGSCKGLTLSEEHKLKIGLANKGKKRTPETIEKWRMTRLERGYKPSEETKLKISHTRLLNPYKPSEETKLKISLANKGRKYTDEQKLESSKRATGKSRPELRGKKRTKEQRKRMSDAKLGKKLSEAQKQAQRDGWARKRERNAK